MFKYAGRVHFRLRCQHSHLTSDHIIAQWFLTVHSLLKFRILFFPFFLTFYWRLLEMQKDTRRDALMTESIFQTSAPPPALSHCGQAFPACRLRLPRIHPAAGCIFHAMMWGKKVTCLGTMSDCIHTLSVALESETADAQRILLEFITSLILGGVST